MRLLGGWGVVGWNNAQDPEGQRHALRVAAVDGGDCVQHISRRGVAGKSVVASDNETKPGGHFLQCRQGVSLYRRSPAPFVCCHDHSIGEYLYICQLPIDIHCISSYTISRY